MSMSWQLDECRAEARVKDRELEESEERHQTEVKVYKQKVKHLLYEQENHLADLKAENMVGTKLLFFRSIFFPREDAFFPHYFAYFFTPCFSNMRKSSFPHSSTAPGEFWDGLDSQGDSLGTFRHLVSPNHPSFQQNYHSNNEWGKYTIIGGKSY